MMMSIKLCAPPLSAPFIEELTLTLRQTSYPDPERLANVIFASITCPSLTSLFIEADDQTGYKHEWPRDAANGFVSRSSFHLTTLSIKSIPLSDSDLIDLLRLLPSLLHLTVDDSRIPANSPSPITTRLSKSLHALHRRSSVAISSPLVQKLQSLSLTFKSSRSRRNFR
ncbi:hypothetical protein BT96DRAFT_419327 [Gymnopus androsaceus JB14]|uniref:F-box domain-containing protein n=1 Tax=Gymnopus androsaceus JB14 TaxID=1447944 RepID=A0A6A4I6P5_9AGAR|nr:hypothetical protein BT96DRAFT_419327 [Gymnopus androsaceus JB14]